MFQNYREAMFPWMRTIDNIAYVVDSGLIKQNHFHSESGIQSLDLVRHSRAGCDTQCDSNANVLTNQWLHRGEAEIFLPRISALIHFRFLGSIWRPR